MKTRLCDKILYVGMPMVEQEAILEARGYTIECDFTYNAPTKWFKTKTDVRKALNKVYNIYHETDYYSNLKECVAKSFFQLGHKYDAYRIMSLCKISNVRENDEDVLELEQPDWRRGVYRLPEQRFDMYPRKFDGHAIIVADSLYRYRHEKIIDLKHRNDIVDSMIRNGNICLILQFCKCPFILQMPIEKFMQYVDFDKFSERELHDLAHLLINYYYLEAKKMRKATTYCEWGFDELRWMEGRDRITNFIVEKTAHFFDIKSRYARRNKQVEIV